MQAPTPTAADDCLLIPAFTSGFATDLDAAREPGGVGRRGESAVKRADRAVAVGEPNFAVGRVDRRSVVLEAEPLGDLARGRVVFGDPCDDRNVCVDGRCGGVGRATKLRRVSLALMGRRDA